LFIKPGFCFFITADLIFNHILSHLIRSPTEFAFMKGIVGGYGSGFRLKEVERESMKIYAQSSNAADGLEKESAKFLGILHPQ